VEVLEGLESPVYIEILLEGNFPAGFKRLQKSVQEKLDEFRRSAPHIQYSFLDPNDGTVEEINSMRKTLSDQGIFPVSLFVVDNGERKEQIIYPYAIVNYGNRATRVNLLEKNVPGEPDEVTLNNSIGLLEYKLINAIQKLQYEKKPVILFTKGHGELEPMQTADLGRDLSDFYSVGWVDLDSTYRIHPEVELLIVAKPRTQFIEKHKFIIDQFVMKGGKVMWLIDKMAVDLDSMRNTAAYVPHDYNLNLDDLFFKWGVRMEPNFVLDLECSKIPLAVGQVAGQPQLELFDWYYHILSSPRSKHPVVKNLDRINLFFPSLIDTIRTKTNLSKTVLLSSSDYSRQQFSPVRLNFDMLRFDPDPEKFNKKQLALGVLVEGVFPSLYENRITADMSSVLGQIGEEFLSQSETTKMLFISDGDIIRNWRDGSSGKYHPLGYNPFERYQYANKQFLLNAIEYLIGEEEIIQARAKEVKLRLLDKVKTKDEKSKWQLINILIPLVVLMLLGVIFNYLRRRKYA
jgi:gliding-associated putative ABC transporter substrate-binding component GldG